MELTNNKASVLKALIYFDIFSYPLKVEDLLRFCHFEGDKVKMEEELAELSNAGFIYQHENFYSLHNDSGLVQRRKSGNKKALELLERAKGLSQFLGSFPFVRAVGISGSLSKSFADDTADIDYFIITASHRLWVARSIMHLFKKLTFLVGRQHDFCMNYYVDEDDLLLKDQNQYVALEAVTIIPALGQCYFNRLWKENRWLWQFYPEHSVTQAISPEIEKKGVRSLLESPMKGRFGDMLNLFLMKLTERKWRRKWARSGKPPHKFDSAMRTTPTESKNHPNDYQDHILAAYQEGINSFERRFGLTLNSV